MDPYLVQVSVQDGIDTESIEAVRYIEGLAAVRDQGPWTRPEPEVCTV